MIEIRENVLNKEIYRELRSSVGWASLSERQMEMAIENCLFSVCAYYDGVPVGMGRIVGDGAVICYIQDLVVMPQAQGKNVGSAILERLKQYVDSITEEGTTMMLCLMSAKGRETFYQKHGFTARPNEKFGPGMIRFITK